MAKHLFRCVLVATVVLDQVSAFLWYDDPTESCSSSQAIGNSIFCCDGACHDGTGIQSPGQCQYVFDGCIDSSTTPSCPSSQVMKTGPVNELLAFDRGLGSCWAGDLCHWASNIWDWTCCDCPPGSVPETPGICVGASRYCVHCTDPLETLRYSEVTSSYLCDSPTIQQRECSLAHEVATFSNTLSLLTTVVGIICPLNKGRDLGITAIALGSAIHDAVTAQSDDDKKGITSARAEAWIAVIAAIKQASIGFAVEFAIDELPLPPIVKAFYELFCIWDGPAGLFFTGVEKSLDAWRDHEHCAPASSKRSLGLARLQSAPSGMFNHLEVRQDTNNPCSEFIDLFPGDFTVFEKLNDDCDQLSQYKPADTFSTDLANATAAAQSFCTSYQSNSTALIDFANMLAAIQNAIPYCDYNGTATSNSSASASSTTSNASTSTTPSSSGIPTGGSTPENTIFLGCYTDSTSGRTLPKASYSSSTSMTIFSCASFCSTYKYFGTEYSGECYCANILTQNATNPASDCNMACSGDSTENCGGPNRLSLYQNTAYVAPTVVASAGGYSYVACYTDSVADRTLAGARQNNNALTIQVCADFCSSSGFAYMGTEYSGECYCGSSLTAGATVAPGGEGDCDMLCSGDSSQVCGGPDRINLYSTTGKIST